VNAKQFGLALALVGLAALNAYGVYLYGPVGFMRLMLANAAGVAAFVDLVIALTMVAVWMIRDAAQRGVNPLPYLLLTLFAGSIGPLIYLIVRIRGSEESNPSVLHPRPA
jgi:hypothetical protein